MKSVLLVLAFGASVFATASCKTKKAATASSVSTSTSSGQEISGVQATTATGTNQGVNAGKVSHKYSVGGCAVVIVISATATEGEITLIPKDKLPSEIDIDGQNILFDYHPLKMPQPAGCTIGMPAEISNITKLK